jgi:GxxExxY protein
MTDLIFKEECYQIVGACMAVHRELGCGFLEAVYQEALEEELKIRNIPYSREQQLTISYKGKTLNKKYQVDFICYGSIIVELKALNELNSIHKSQLINYLKITGLELGILVSFGNKSLETKRVYNPQNKLLVS